MVIFINGVGFIPYKRALSAAGHPVEAAGKVHEAIGGCSSAATQKLPWTVMRTSEDDETGHPSWSASSRRTTSIGSSEP